MQIPSSAKLPKQSVTVSETFHQGTPHSSYGSFTDELSHLPLFKAIVNLLSCVLFLINSTFLTPSKPTAMATATIIRASPVKDLRSSTPYVDFGPLSHAHPEPDPEPFDRSGVGGRHHNDRAPFSLWDDQRHDFRNPAPEELVWIKTNFHVDRLSWEPPNIIIETKQPPRPVPLTVACAPAIFLPYSGPTTSSMQAYNALGDRANTAYAGKEDPLSFTLPRWTIPTPDQRQLIMSTLLTFCDPKVIHYLGNLIVVELRVTVRRYEPHSLPRQLAGVPANYFHGSNPEDHFVQAVPTQAQQRRIIPSAAVGHDVTNYLDPQRFNALSAGVRVSTGHTTHQGISVTSRATTAGVRVRTTKGRDGLRDGVTVANHGFPATNDVHHPTPNGDVVGTIRERIEHLDIAIMHLKPGIRYDNSNYFEASRPAYLMKAQDMAFEWFCADGMSCGLVVLLLRRFSDEVPVSPGGFASTMGPVWTASWQLGYKTTYGFQVTGPVGDSEAKEVVAALEGICGAPIVQWTSRGTPAGVGGFFHLGDAAHAQCAALDEFIDQGWEVV